MTRPDVNYDLYYCNAVAAEAGKGAVRLGPKPGRSRAPPTEQEVLALEHKAGLRVPGDDAPDIERRKQVGSQSS